MSVDVRTRVFQVTHKHGDTETVYLVSAVNSHEAKGVVREALGGWIANSGDSYAVTEYAPEMFKLYTINRKTGEMS